MRNTDYEIVPATAEIMKSFYGTSKTCRAFAAVRGDEILGIAGIYFQNDLPILFSDLKASERGNKRLVVHGIRKMRELVEEYHMPVFAEAEDSEVPMKHIGFKNLKDKIWHSSRL